METWNYTPVLFTLDKDLTNEWLSIETEKCRFGNFVQQNDKFIANLNSFKEETRHVNEFSMASGICLWMRGVRWTCWRGGACVTVICIGTDTFEGVDGTRIGVIFGVLMFSLVVRGLFWRNQKQSHKSLWWTISYYYEGSWFLTSRWDVMKSKRARHQQHHHHRLTFYDLFWHSEALKGYVLTQKVPLFSH